MIRPSLPAAAVAALLVLGAAPAFAGTAEDNFMAKLVGSWAGAGSISGSETGALDCTMSFRGKKGGVSFRGKCRTEKFGDQSFSGSIAYNDKKAQYEATSPSGEISIGKKSGSSVVFTTKLKSIAGSGESVMKLTTSKVTVDTSLKRSGSGGAIKSHVVMSK